jgi:8-oxoguanine deaminase
MSRLLIKNALRIATMNDAHQEIVNGHILIEDGVIASVGEGAYPHKVEEVIDAANMVLLPGFVNTHHLFQSLTRNIPRMQEAALFDWLSNHYEIWRELTESSMHASALTALLEMMKSGVTTSSDHHYLFPHRTNGELIDAEIEAAKTLGLRFQPTRGSMTLGKSHGGLPPDDIVQTEEKVFTDIERLLDRYHDASDGAMVRISLAPCAPFSVTQHQMRQTVEFAAKHNLQIHTHLAETLDEEEYCIKNYQVRPVEYARSLGWICGNAWFAHAVHLNDDEIKLMGSAHSGISHCPSSNMRLGSGIARIKELLQSGARVSLGVDGTASNDSGNFLAEIRNAMLISRLRPRDCWLTARDVLWMATRGGAGVLGRKDIGSIEIGKRADLALFSVNGLEYAGALSDPVAALVFTVRMSPVDHLIVNGKHVIKNSQSSVNERAIIDDHNRFAAAMLKTAEKQTGIDFHKPLP